MAVRTDDEEPASGTVSPPSMPSAGVSLPYRHLKNYLGEGSSAEHPPTRHPGAAATRQNALFDHPVRTQEERWRDREVQSLGGSRVDHQLELDSFLHR